MNHQIVPSQKRNLLWNMIEPGDPYDIKKSLIARVPGDKRIFMGDHLQLVCLFQAAQIERLHDSLREYGVRFKELERVQLDRHSYQTQIKQLMEMSEEGKGHKQQILKLKEFIRKQGLEMDDMRKKAANQDQQLELKYQQALGKLQIFYNENNNLKIDIQSLENRINAMRSTHQKQMEQLRTMLESDRRIQLQRQINEINNGFKNQRNHLEQQIRRLKDRIDSQIEHNDQLRLDIQSLNQTISQYERKLQQSNQVESELAKHEQKLRVLSQQLTRIQDLLNQKSKDNNDAKFSLERKDLEIKQLKASITNLQDQLAHVNNLYRDIQKKLDEYLQKQAQLLEYQQKLVMLTQEVERLRHMNQNKQTQNIEYYNRINQFESDISLLKRQYRDLELALQESELQKQRIRGQMNSSSQHRSIQIKQLEQKITSLLRNNQTLQRQQQNYATQCEIRMNTLIGEIDRLNDIIKTKIEQLRNKNSEIERHTIRLRQYQIDIDDLRRQSGQIGGLEIENQNLRSQISQYKGQKQKLYAEMRATTSELESENEGLRKRIRENEVIILKANDLQRTIYGLKGDLEIVNQGLKSRNDQNSKLRLQISDVRHINSRLSEQIQGSRRQLTNSMNINHQNNELRNRIILLSKQLQRVNGNLGSKLQELKQAKQLIHKSKISVEDYSSKEQTFKRTQIQLKQTISIYQQQISSLNLDIEKFKKRIQQLQNDYNLIRRDNQERQYEYSRQRQGYIKQLRNKDKDLLQLQQKYNIQLIQNNQQILKDSNHKITSLQNQIHTLTDNLSRKSNDLIKIQADNRQKDLLINKLKNQISSMKIKLTQLTRIRVAYEQSMASINSLTQENQSIKDKIEGQGSIQIKLESYQERVVFLSTQIQRLNRTIQDKQNQIIRLKRNDGVSAQQLQRISIQHQQQMRLLEIRIKGEYSQSLRRVEFLQDQLRRYSANSNNYSSDLLQKDSDIARWKKLYDQIVIKLNEQMSIGSEFEEKVHKLSKQVDRLNQVLQRKVQEYEYLKNLYNQAANSNDGREQQNINRMQAYIQQIQRLNNNLRIKVDQLNNLNTNYNILSQKYQTLIQENQSDERKRQIMAIEIQRLNSTIKLLNDKSNNQSTELVEEIERLNNALRLKVIESQQWQDQVNRSGEQLNKQFSELQINYQQALRDIQGYKSTLRQFQQKQQVQQNRFEKVSNQFSRLNQIIETLKYQNQQLKTDNYNLRSEINQYQTLAEMNRKLSQQIDRLNQIKSELDQQIADMRIRYVDEAALHKRLNEHLTLFVVLFAQIESLRVRVKDKQKEVEEVRRTSLAPLRIV